MKTYQYYSSKDEFNPDTDELEYTGNITPINAFVVISSDDISGKAGIYAPIGQHSEASLEYIKADCDEITKEDYIEASDGFYTPEEYLKESKS